MAGEWTCAARREKELCSRFKYRTIREVVFRWRSTNPTSRLSKFNHNVGRGFGFIHYPRIVRAPLCSLALLSALTFVPCRAQTLPPPAAPAAAQPRAPYFSGNVIELTGNSITVVRKSSSGKDTVKHVFLLDAQTKVEGKLRANVRVTVRYEIKPEGERAVRIIVRG